MTVTAAMMGLFLMRREERDALSNIDNSDGLVRIPEKLQDPFVKRFSQINPQRRILMALHLAWSRFVNVGVGTVWDEHFYIY
jgi:hypothetical protein